MEGEIQQLNRVSVGLELMLAELKNMEDINNTNFTLKMEAALSF
jgi:hypothetical protein